MKFLELTIVADANDCDYLTNIEVIDQETFDRLLPVFKAIQSQEGQNWITSEYGHGHEPRYMYKEIDDNLIEEFDDLVPYGEYGVHTIAVLKVREITISKEWTYVGNN